MTQIFHQIWLKTIGFIGEVSGVSMTEVFADAFFFIAVLNPRDQHHEEVRRVAAKNRFRVVSTAWVLVEVADALCESSMRAKTHRFLADFLADTSPVIASEPEWLQRGLDLFGNRPDKDWSLTDCISFAVMRDRGVTHALTGDRHYAQAGYVPLFA